MIWTTPSPTGKNHVVNVLQNFVFTCRASWLTLPWWNIDVFELEGCRCSVPGASQDREGDEGLIAAFNLGARRHHVDDMPDLLQGGHSLLATRFGTLVSLAERLKYSASEYEIRDLYPGCPASQMKNRFKALRVA